MSGSTSTTRNGGTVIEPAARIILPQQSRMDSRASYRSARDFERLKSERVRLETFSLAPGWPVSFISPEDCAKAGFFFLQDGDKVQCTFCRGVAGEWVEGDVPAEEHRLHFPRCPFVCNLPVGNVPIGQEREVARTREQELAAGIDVCGPFAMRFFSDDAALRGAQPLDGTMDDVATSLAIQVCGNGPTHKSLVTYASRLKTYGSSWPASTAGQSSEKLAEAGFFYLGESDHVKCFYCDGGLKNWEPGDDPWLEHARWFPNCSFLLLNKGGNYVSEVFRKKPPVAVPELQPEPATEELCFSIAGVSIFDDTVKKDSDSSSSEKCKKESPETEKEEPKDSKCDKESKKELELEEELRQLREATQCKICMDNKVGVVFLPCGHLVSCTRCATAISNCAVCRQPIKAYVKTYMS